MNRPEFAYTVAIVEDELVLQQEMAFQLTQYGFVVSVFENANQLYRFLAVNPVAMVILDIGLPDEDGMTICRHLREHNSSMGIVFVTARGQRDDKLLGLEAGADAYLVKPIDIAELVLILKRHTKKHLNVGDATGIFIRPPDFSWQLEPNAIYLLTPNKQRIKLTLNESQLLRVLLAKMDGICSHAELYASLGLQPEDLDKHRVEVIISRLSSKIENQCGLKLPIQSFRGVGYGLLTQK
ncbi:MAG: response regulator transcription factor [Gallionella sp.]|nr:response regulator transcription factor [Gallionella sp.]MDD4960478.1 response regulator transcription factor [Gallionella sp.]